MCRQYDQDFFKEMKQETGVDLENIVYYKDEVHFFASGGVTICELCAGAFTKDTTVSEILSHF
jgi:hypothetical protein